MSEQLAPETDVQVEETSTADPFAPSAEPAAAEATLGVPAKRRRTAKIDAVLADAKDVALAAVEEIAPDGAIGLVHHLRGEEDRLTTHLFECALPGYRGWFWFATLARVPRSKQATVCEVGLLPGDDALLAPAWVPWADRVLPEDHENEDYDSDALESELDAEAEEDQLTPAETAQEADVTGSEAGHEAEEAEGEAEEAQV